MFILVIDFILSSHIHIDTSCEAIGYNSMHQLTVKLYWDHSIVLLIHQHQYGMNCHTESNKFKNNSQMQSLLLGGDFNYPGIEWSTSSLTDSYLSVNFHESLIVFVQDFFRANYY